jgi:FAD-linked oxidoreductase
MLKLATRAEAQETWSNWSGSVQAQPAAVARPRSEAELAEAVRRASKVRVAGSGHSFTPLCQTTGTLVSLDDLPGTLVVAPDRATARIPAGWPLHRVTSALWEQGLSLANQGDIDRQALAGALATGTHGTGAELGSLSTQARGFRLMLTDCEVVWCDAQTRPELFQAQRLSLGLLGVALEIEMAVLPAYHLEERIERRPLAEALELFPEWAAAHRHAEFFVFPYADVVMLKTLHPAEPEGAFKEPGPVEETVWRLCCELGAAAPPFIPTLQKLLTRGQGRATRRVGPAHRIFPSERTVKFEEMEFELPREAGLPTLQSVIDWIRRKELPVAFPFEFRWTAADDIWLSPFAQGPCASISMHQYAPMPWRELFAEAEAIFRSAGGRPHWGKRHTLTRADVDALYPNAERFRSVRRAHDPEGKFLNEHLQPLFS